jgi:hypothetical protein
VARPLNHGFRLASGLYAAILDDDDLALPHLSRTPFSSQASSN